MVVLNLGNHQANTYSELFECMLSKLLDLGANMCIKLHDLFGYLNHFPETLQVLVRTRERAASRLSPHHGRLQLDY